jgi:hypothetical protein
VEYLLFITVDPGAETYDPAQDNIEEWVAEGELAGTRRSGDRLRPPEDGTIVRVRNGELLVTDGPFSETKEWIAGYDVLECADLDEAIAIAAKHPMARFGQIEIRPVWPIDE